MLEGIEGDGVVQFVVVQRGFRLGEFVNPRPRVQPPTRRADTDKWILCTLLPIPNIPLWGRLALWGSLTATRFKNRPCDGRVPDREL
jgi:hypothetical protein